MNKIFDFITNNYKTIVKVCFGLFILYYLIFFLTPNVKMSAEQVQKLDSLNNSINNLETHNEYLEGRISDFNAQMNVVDNNIQNIKGQKTIIKEYYHEKISNVDKLTDAELDSFFTNRYQY
jgi:small nuclear ribonucleoprotein (snRNP)-like protein